MPTHEREEGAGNAPDRKRRHIEWAGNGRFVLPRTLSLALEVSSATHEGADEDVLISASDSFLGVLRVYRRAHKTVLMRGNKFGRALARSGRREDAAGVHRECGETARTFLGPSHSAALVAGADTATLRAREGDIAGAEQIAVECLRLAQADPADRKPFLKSMATLLDALFRQRAYDEVARLGPDYLSMRQQRHRKEALITPNCMYNVAMSMLETGRHAEASSLYRECLALRQRVLGAEHGGTLAVMHQLAFTKGASGMHAEAISVYRECLDPLQRVLGREHEGTLTAMHNMAFSLYAVWEHGEAVQIGRECLALRRRILGEEHKDTINTMHNLAAALYANDENEEAAHVFRECLAIKQRVLGAEHEDSIGGMYFLASALNDAGEHEESISICRECLTLAQRILGADHDITQKVASALE